jgi:TRAP-type C4-dicarboxylate transport system substrate-binding protein
MEVVILSAKDRAPFKSKTKPVYDKWIKEIGEDLVKKAEEIVKKAVQ